MENSMIKQQLKERILNSVQDFELPKCRKQEHNDKYTSVFIEYIENGEQIVELRCEKCQFSKSGFLKSQQKSQSISLKYILRQIIDQSFEKSNSQQQLQDLKEKMQDQIFQFEKSIEQVKKRIGNLEEMKKNLGFLDHKIMLINLIENNFCNQKTQSDQNQGQEQGQSEDFEQKIKEMFQNKIEFQNNGEIKIKEIEGQEIQKKLVAMKKELQINEINLNFLSQIDWEKQNEDSQTIIQDKKNIFLSTQEDEKESNLNKTEKKQPQFIQIDEAQKLSNKSFIQETQNFSLKTDNSQSNLVNSSQISLKQETNIITQNSPQQKQIQFQQIQENQQNNCQQNQNQKNFDLFSHSNSQQKITINDNFSEVPVSARSLFQQNPEITQSKQELEKTIRIMHMKIQKLQNEIQDFKNQELLAKNELHRNYIRESNHISYLEKTKMIEETYSAIQFFKQKLETLQ